MMFCGKHQYIATVHQIKVLHGVFLISRFFRLNSTFAMTQRWTSVLVFGLYSWHENPGEECSSTLLPVTTWSVNLRLPHLNKSNSEAAIVQVKASEFSNRINKKFNFILICYARSAHEFSFRTSLPIVQFRMCSFHTS